MIRSMA